jgi:phosphonate degradation associated HDIG domain protein
MSGIVDQLIELLAGEGTQQYGEEQVSQGDHALQSAFLAESEGAPATLIAAALLHDIGHLVYGVGSRPAARSMDDRHEKLGAAHLQRAFDPAVTEPIRLHVAAKRYLCGTDPGYFGLLSKASVRSLELQGGPLIPAEAAAFRAMTYAGDAIRLRRWDEMAKIPGRQTPNLDHYRTTLCTVLSPQAASDSADVGLTKGNL